MGNEKFRWWQRVDDRLHTWWRQADDWLRDRLPALDVIEIHTNLRYAWIWKFLISWEQSVTISFYPDYENARFEVTVWPGRK